MNRPTIALATDGSDHAQAAVAFANALAWPPNTSIRVVSVVETPLPKALPSGHRLTRAEADWRKVLELAHVDARDRAWRDVVDATAELRGQHSDIFVEEAVRLGEPAGQLLAYLHEVNASLIIAGARGQTVFQGLLLGSVSEALATEAGCPALIVRRAPEAIGQVLLAVRTMDDADRLASAFCALPIPPEARLSVVTVLPDIPRVRADLDLAAAGQLDDVLRDLAEEEHMAATEVGERVRDRVLAVEPNRKVDLRLVRGEAAPALLALQQEQDADLVIVGARERRGLAQWLGLGSVSRKLVRRIPTAVLVVRALDKAQHD